MYLPIYLPPWKEGPHYLEAEAPSSINAGMPYTSQHRTNGGPRANTRIKFVRCSLQSTRERKFTRHICEPLAPEGRAGRRYERPKHCSQDPREKGGGCSCWLPHRLAHAHMHRPYVRGLAK
ncbi:hypothetical protein C8Q78DRAFT_172579 [Trametes maxima]|nr:hypothetical protein C8Q78DRAFT_172579 [Trametes maxima]